MVDSLMVDKIDTLPPVSTSSPVNPRENPLDAALWLMPKGPLKLKQADLRVCLDALVERYKSPAFIAHDPIRFPHRFKNDPKTCEWVGFLTAMLSYGRRETILDTVEGVLSRMDGLPGEFLENFKPKVARERFRGFVYRFNTESDLVALLSRLHRIYDTHDSLEAFFAPSMAKMSGQGLQGVLSDFMDRLIDLGGPLSPGLKFMLAHPGRGGACKRLQMYLRWMVRQETDPDAAVDFGLWQNTLSPAQLLVPMDTHVSKMARRFQMTCRLSDDWRTAEEITAAFRKFNPTDPVVYDFALFGLGIEQSRQSLPLSSSPKPPRRHS